MVIKVYWSNISAQRTRSSTYICASFATRRLLALTIPTVLRCNDANIDIVTSYTNLFPFLLVSYLHFWRKRSSERERKRYIYIHRSKYSQKEEAKESLFTLPMTELIETTRNGTRFSIFKDTSSGAFPRYFCRRKVNWKLKGYGKSCEIHSTDAPDTERREWAEARNVNLP